MTSGPSGYICKSYNYVWFCPSNQGFSQSGITCSRPDTKDNGPLCPATKRPIGIGNGNKWLVESDFPAQGLLKLSRFYNSKQGTLASPFGANWRGVFQQYLAVGYPTAVWLYTPEGKSIRYTISGSNFVPDSDINIRLWGEVGSSGGLVGYRLLNADNSIELFDTQGKLIGVTDQRGYALNMSYNAQNRVASATDPFGKSLTFDYDSSGKVSRIAFNSVEIATYQYGAANNLGSVRYSDGTSKLYHYEDARFPNALTGITDELGVRYATYSYDAQGRAIAESLAGNVESYQLAFGSGATTVTDPLGTQRVYSFQNILSVPRLKGVTQPAGVGCGASSQGVNYDGNGNAYGVIDHKNVVTQYTYDQSRNLETKRIEALAKPEARTISSQWHSYWRLPVRVAEAKKLTTWVYNGDGGVFCAPQTATVPSITGGTQPIGVLCSKTEQATSDTNGTAGFYATLIGTPRTWTYTYNQYGQVLTANGPRTDVTDLTTYTYYDAADPDLGKRGNLATITNALGQVTQITAYDLNGNPLTIIDPNGVVTTLTYDLRQRLTGRSVGGESTSYQYDAVGQLTRVTLPDGSYTAYTYDPAHRLTGIADALGNSIAYTLDAMGNRTKEDIKDPAGQLARTRSHIYDALSRLAQDIGAQGQTTRYEYDANGNRTKVTDPLNQVTVSSYDPINRLIQVTDPGTGQTRYGWDGQDRLAQVTDPRNRATTYTVDGLGNRQALQSPDTGNTSSTFDAAGNELTRTDAKGQVTTTTYDALNRPLRITYADGSFIQNTWDLGSNGQGRLGKIDEYDGSGTLLRSLQYSYTPQGRVQGETRTIGTVSHTIAYGYSAGQLTSLTLPSAKQLAYTRNAAGQITQVTLIANGQSKTLLQNVSYHPFGGIKSFTDGAGQVHSRGNDQDGRTSSYTLGNQTWMLSYDAASRIAGQIDAGNAANSATYGYDGLDRLTGATLPATTYGYGYDATGNRTSQTSGSTTRTYTTAATSNRLQSLSNPNQTLSYDANGSLTGDGSNQYAYDPRGRLNQTVTAAGTTTYQVNALGQRVRKSNGTANTDVLYHYDQAGHLLAESNASGNILREYVWLDDIPVAVLQ